jgi:hypothetical protein
MSTNPSAGRRVSPNELTSEQRAAYEKIKARAKADLDAGLLGPPVERLDVQAMPKFGMTTPEAEDVYHSDPTWLREMMLHAGPELWNVGAGDAGVNFGQMRDAPDL